LREPGHNFTPSLPYGLIAVPNHVRGELRLCPPCSPPASHVAPLLAALSGCRASRSACPCDLLSREICMSTIVASGATQLSTRLRKPVTLVTDNRDHRWVSSGWRAGDDPLTSIADASGQYNALYQAHQARVLRLCRLLLSDPDEADDVAQEIFLKLHRQYQQSGNTVAWAPWLTRVAVNACRDRRRSGWWKWWREGHQDFDEADFSSSSLTPEQEAVGREKREDIWRCFRQLSSRQQEVFALRYLEEYSTEEVAEVLSISTGSIKRHLYRAVHHMREALGGSR
jgi:RNA polymerase sigma-70 factor, ECF subfamily